MKRILGYILLVFFSMSAFFSCIYPFTPEGLDDIEDFVVMEGDINIGMVSTFMPSKTASISEDGSYVTAIELEDLYVESEVGTKYGAYTLETVTDEFYSEDKKNIYTLNTENLSKSERHRLVFKYEGHTYMSDWLEYVDTPPIDSVTYEVSQDKEFLNIYAHSSNFDESVKYFKWDYREDWEFHSVYLKNVIYVPIDPNDPYSVDRIYEMGEDMVPPYYCWGKNISTDINIYTTEGLTDNVIRARNIKTIPKNSRRISYLYAIEVYQKAITKEAYSYWRTLMNNSDGTGGLFSPQPNEMKGNITCQENPQEKVIGYISSCSTQSKRIFIDGEKLDIYKSDVVCEYKQASRNSWRQYYTLGWDAFRLMRGSSDEALWAPPGCIDCTRYGTKAKPDFWPTDHE